ncbi:Metallo-dependent phosphatase [Piromyces finnis]|uniref:Purple acid phosphatase n=1 Tax=Piromyces finnis TaxID=1754191 RepID=A0A1Y1V614_9FUNG|nr:Metallo-dependent phosphatase [Piromyces finnis]|eukprot:ORX46843.1 Metallo-dependent phosphatase [Piromyces finnis]
MKKAILGITLSLLVSNVKSQNCWAESLGYPCCKEKTPNVEYVDESGSWGIENDIWCGIISTNENNKYVKVKQVISNDPRLEVSEIQVPENYCWTSISKGVNCCNEYDPENVSYAMDGSVIYNNYNNNDIKCGIKGYNAKWNDREKFVYTKDQWEDFKLKWDGSYNTNFERLAVFVGDNESELNFGWLSLTDKEPAILFGKMKDLSDGEIFTGSNTLYRKIFDESYYSNKVTVTGLERESVYYYKRKLNGRWEDEIIQFKTYNPDNFSFIYVGDPQIGGSKERVSVSDFTQKMGPQLATRNDAFNWNMTVYNSFDFVKQPSLLLSTGDQIENECFDLIDSEIYTQETQYSAFLLPRLMQTIPIATTVGNHESISLGFKNHFNTPNSYLTPVEKYHTPGYNYFFKYNNVLVVVLETNYGYCDDFKEVLRQAHAKYPNTDWRIAMFHHNIYGNGKYHSQDYHITDVLRPCLTELLSNYKFDLVINGHDHIYTASYFISYSNNDKGYTPEKISQNRIYENPKGTFYITANCSTGSKLYESIDRTMDYVYNYGQNYLSSFGVLDFSKEDGKVKLTISNYDVDTGNKVDGDYIIQKPAKCWAEAQGYPCCEITKEVVYVDDYLWGIENEEWCGIIEDDIPINNTPIISDLKPIKNCWSYSEGYLCCTNPQNQKPNPGEHLYGVDLYGRYCGIIPPDEIETPITYTTTTTKRITTTTRRITTTTTTKRTTITTTTTTTSSYETYVGQYAKKWQQCGGIGYSGPTQCESGSECVATNEFYSQCL